MQLNFTGVSTVVLNSPRISQHQTLSKLCHISEEFFDVAEQIIAEHLFCVKGMGHISIKVLTNS